MLGAEALLLPTLAPLPERVAGPVHLLAAEVLGAARGPSQREAEEAATLEQGFARCWLAASVAQAGRAALPQKGALDPADRLTPRSSKAKRVNMPSPSIIYLARQHV